MLFSHEARGHVLKRYREKIERSQTEVCQITGINNAHLSQCESGRRGFSEKNLLKLLKLYGVNKQQYIKDVIRAEEVVEREKAQKNIRQKKLNISYILRSRR